MQIRPKTLIADLDRYLRCHPELRNNIGIAFLLGFFAFCVAAFVLS
jgi:hypothetical protein